MKTKSAPQTGADKRDQRTEKKSSTGDKPFSEIQREAESRSRGDSPSATKNSERSPRQENL